MALLAAAKALTVSIPKESWQSIRIKELDPEIIRTFVDKIYVEQSEKVPGTN
ncbi:DUF4368 domain-containing protein [Peptostreptococcus anaerobius]|uniref:DUF4368 domain-containing protein n=1 Tax=Peptostreptococcus anaerobius TaxID=1261 RepID=UPI0002A1E4C9|nr:DUF4368 domain-containing protein [Peptostreptococcus anaerobius]EKX94090.1 hypothetical protein HMPREF9998_00553 [Peptostreptococcus anaerobius VPI 4330 = DSM 2949]